MKKHISLLLGVMMVFTMNSYPQKDSDNLLNDSSYIQSVFKKNDKFMQVGIPVGYYGYGYGSRVGFAFPVTASFEYAVTNHISVGGHVGLARYNYRGINDDRYSFTFFSFGPRGSFHYLPYLNDLLNTELDESKFDFYLSFLSGLEIRNYNTNSDYYEDVYDGEINLILGPVAGFKYYFNPNLSLYFEGGRGTFSYGTLGLSLKF